MADRAYRIDEQGNKQLVCADYLDETDRDETYLCAGISQMGKHKGEACDTQMTLVLSQKSRNYFSVTKASKHIRYCEFCESAKESRLVHLDLSCRDKTDADILKGLLGRTKSQRYFRTGCTSGTSEKNDASEETEDDDKDITIVRRNPMDAHELYKILSEYLPEQRFAGKSVREWIIDQRTFSYYIEYGLKDPQIALTILKKINPNYLPEALQGSRSKYTVFRGSFYGKHGCLYFLIPKESEILGSVFGSANTEFAVIASWNRFYGARNAYFCEPIQSDKQYTLNLNLD